MLRHSKLQVLSAITVAALVSGGGVACAANDGGAPPPSGGLPSAGDFTRVPLGELARNPETEIAARIDNPLAGNAQAIQTGQHLFAQMNCASCHGYDAKGGMGPDLTTKYWRYGGTPAAIYKSIFEGRPQGMPAWGGVLPSEAIWPIVAYIQSLGGTFPPDAYQASLQGDRPGEHAAPELAFERELSGLTASSPRPQVSGTANPQGASPSGQR